MDSLNSSQMLKFGVHRTQRTAHFASSISRNTLRSISCLSQLLKSIVTTRCTTPGMGKMKDIQHFNLFLIIHSPFYLFFQKKGCQLQDPRPRYNNLLHALSRFSKQKYHQYSLKFELPRFLFPSP